MDEKSEMNMDSHIQVFVNWMSGKGYDGEFTTLMQYHGLLGNSLRAYLAAAESKGQPRFFPIYIETGISERNRDDLRISFVVDFDDLKGLYLMGIGIDRIKNGEAIKVKDFPVKNWGEVPEKEQLLAMVSEVAPISMNNKILAFEKLMKEKGYDGKFSTGISPEGTVKEVFDAYYRMHLNGTIAKPFPIRMGTYFRFDYRLRGTIMPIYASFKLCHNADQGIYIKQLKAEMQDLYGKKLTRLKLASGNREIPGKDEVIALVEGKHAGKLEKKEKNLRKHPGRLFERIAPFADTLKQLGYDRPFQTAAAYQGELASSLTRYFTACLMEDRKGPIFPVKVSTPIQWKDELRDVTAIFLVDYKKQSGLQVKELKIEWLAERGKNITVKRIPVLDWKRMPNRDQVISVIRHDFRESKARKIKRGL